jgi:hypothetical protein
MPSIQWVTLPRDVLSLERASPLGRFSDEDDGTPDTMVNRGRRPLRTEMRGV